MKRCENYVGVTCINGNCPIALKEGYAEYGCDVINTCDECPYYKGCEDCAFSEECKDKPIEVFDKQGEFTPEFKDLVDSYIREEIQKVTTDGKLDYIKAIKYIKEASEKTGVPVSQVLRQVRKEKRLKKYAKD